MINIPQVYTPLPTQYMDWTNTINISRESFSDSYIDIITGLQVDITVQPYTENITMVSGIMAMLVMYQQAFETWWKEPPFVIDGGIDWKNTLATPFNDLWQTIARALDIEINNVNNVLSDEQKVYWAGTGKNLIPTTTSAQLAKREIAMIVEIEFPAILKTIYPNINLLQKLQLNKKVA